MNILLDKLPTRYEGLKINTNFRSFILFELLMQDNSLSGREKILMSLDIFYKDLEITDIKKAMEGILWFYTLGDKQNKKNDTNADKPARNKIYSYEYDANLIYSAFKHDYNIDLNEIEQLHWWKFKSLFDGLNEENKICQIMGYRAIDLSKIKDKDEKNKYKKLKRHYALPDERTDEEKERDFADAFW